MAISDHLARLREGAECWNAWRKTQFERPDLSGADLSRANLIGADLSYAKLTNSSLSRANLSNANLSKSDLCGAKLGPSNLSAADLQEAVLMRADLRKAYCKRVNLRGATLWDADLSGAVLNEADLKDADFKNAILDGASLKKADLRGASMEGTNLAQSKLRNAKLGGTCLFNADLTGADLTGADLTGAYLRNANLSEAKLNNTNLSGSNLISAILVRTELKNANLTGCYVYGLSAWDVQLEGTIQSNLVITPMDAPEITVDNLEVAQFIYLLLNNQRIRQVIDTIASKVVLILGRFTPERKVVLDAIRDELRKRDYLPLLFDFEKPANRDITETVSTLAHMARFVIADITDAKSIPQELTMIVPDLPSVPVQPLLLSSQVEYGMFEHFKRFPWVLEPYLYETQEQLLSSLDSHVIGPAEAKSKEQTVK
jgi:uncharacterized protein YjbI with pentapeptide repeats